MTRFFLKFAPSPSPAQPVPRTTPVEDVPQDPVKLFFENGTTVRHALQRAVPDVLHEPDLQLHVVAAYIERYVHSVPAGRHGFALTLVGAFMPCDASTTDGIDVTEATPADFFAALKLEWDATWLVGVPALPTRDQARIDALIGQIVPLMRELLAAGAPITIGHYFSERTFFTRLSVHLGNECVLINDVFPCDNEHTFPGANAPKPEAP